MEKQRTFTPIAIAAAVAIVCTVLFFATDIEGPKQAPGLNMFSASVIEKAGATVTPTDRTD